MTVPPTVNSHQSSESSELGEQSNLSSSGRTRVSASPNPPISHPPNLPLLLGNLADRAAAQERRSLLKIWCGAAAGTAISLVLGLNALTPQFILGASLQSAGIATAIAALCKGRIGSKP